MVALLLLMAGCVLFPGTIEEQLPKLRDKLPESTRVYIPNPLNPQGGFLYTRNAQVIVDEFRHAFAARGISVHIPDRRSGSRRSVAEDAMTNKCDVVLFTNIESWEYGEAGFSGFGGRDEVTLSVVLADPARDRILSRSRIYVANGIGRSSFGGNDNPGEVVAPIIRKYVFSLFPPCDEKVLARRKEEKK